MEILLQNQMELIAGGGGLAFLILLYLLFFRSSGGSSKSSKELLLSIQQKEGHGDGHVFEVLAKGWFPVKTKTLMGGVTYIFDGYTKYPCFSTLSETMESNSKAFAKKVSFGEVDKNTTLEEWSPICKFDLNNLLAPHSGERTFDIVTYLYAAEDNVEFDEGECKTPELIIQRVMTTMKLSIKGSGYREAQKITNETKRCSIDIAVGLGFASGEFIAEYKNLIGTWISRAMKKASEENRESVQQDLVESFESSYSKYDDAGGYNFSLLQMSIDTLNETNSEAAKHETMELCMALLTVSTKLHGTQITSVKTIANALNIDEKLLEKNLERIMIKTAQAVESIVEDGNEEILVGIDVAKQTPKEIMKTINMQYRKWNGRLNSLSPGVERENAQQMLDLLATLRRKYEKEIAEAIA